MARYVLEPEDHKLLIEILIRYGQIDTYHKRLHLLHKLASDELNVLTRVKLDATALYFAQSLIREVLRYDNLPHSKEPAITVLLRYLQDQVEGHLEEREFIDNLLWRFLESEPASTLAMAPSILLSLSKIISILILLIGTIVIVGLGWIALPTVGSTITSNPWIVILFGGATGLYFLSRMNTISIRRIPPPIEDLEVPSNSSPHIDQPVKTQVDRWVDINSPRTVHLNEQRISVIVRLAERKPRFSVVENMILTVTTDAPVIVQLTAPGFEHLNETELPILLSDKGEGNCVFDLHPLEVRTSSLQFDFFQKGQLLGNVSVSIEIVGEHINLPNLRMATGLSQPAKVEVADLMLVVKIDKRDNDTRLLYTLREGGDPGREFHSVTLQGDLATYAAQLYEGLNRLAKGQAAHPSVEAEVYLSTEDVAETLIGIGYQLWDNCLPQDFRTLYAERRMDWKNKSLMIVSDDPYLPWEMVLPYGDDWKDEQQWCLTYQMTRWLRRDAQGNGNEGPPGALPWQTFATLAPADSALPYASSEIDYLKRLAQTRNLQYVSPPSVTLSDIRKLFKNTSYSWMHVIGHGKYWKSNDASDAVFVVEGGNVLSTNELRGPEIKSHFKTNRPGVVFNICEGARSGWSLSGHSGWANHFISYGAGLYLAPAWKVSDRLAYQFMETLYGELNNHQTVAEAVRAARRKIRDEQNPAWLAYCVYAHPNAMVEIMDMGGYW